MIFKTTKKKNLIKVVMNNGEKDISSIEFFENKNDDNLHCVGFNRLSKSKDDIVFHWEYFLQAIANFLNKKQIRFLPESEVLKRYYKTKIKNSELGEDEQGFYMEVNNVK